MHELSREEPHDLVDVRTDAEVGDTRRHQRFRTLADKLALGTATVGVFGLDPVGLALLVAAGCVRDPRRASIPTRTRSAVDAPGSESATAHRRACTRRDSVTQPTALLAADVVVIVSLGGPRPTRSSPRGRACGPASSCCRRRRTSDVEAGARGSMGCSSGRASCAGSTSPSPDHGRHRARRSRGTDDDRRPSSRCGSCRRCPRPRRPSWSAWSRTSIPDGSTSLGAGDPIRVRCSRGASVESTTRPTARSGSACCCPAATRPPRSAMSSASFRAALPTRRRLRLRQRVDRRRPPRARREAGAIVRHVAGTRARATSCAGCSRRSTPTCTCWPTATTPTRSAPPRS